MSFNKVGTPQKITVVSSKCSICGKNPGNNLVNGSFICNQCSQKQSNTDEVKDAK